MDCFERYTFDAIVTDLYMPEISGIEFLKRAKALRDEVPVVVITAFGAVETAVDAMRAGAFDYVTKPFEQTEIADVVEKAVNTRRLSMLEVIPGGKGLAFSGRNPILEGQGKAMSELASLMEKVAASPTPILIYGEQGTGKEMLVEEIHRRSGRGKESLVRINAAALVGSSVDSELFGLDGRPGRLELAGKGTLFIDEIGELSKATQIRLADALESLTYERGRDGLSIPLEARIIAGNNSPLEESGLIDALRYRLSVISLHLPPLRERREDIPEIVAYFLARISLRLGCGKKSASPAFLSKLKALSWPGNLRQLENVLERAALLSGDAAELLERDIPEELVLSSPEAGISRFREIVKNRSQSVERDLIREALRSTNSNVTRAAEHLGLSRKGLQIKMKELGIR
jgi:DNA-binding NtrC family response regulator